MPCVGTHAGTLVSAPPHDWLQPLLGVEGDPMRLLFERDLTPHPQYAAFYQWLQHGYGANAVLHFGMHGTGAPAAAA